jgi:hypothetical protein
MKSKRFVNRNSRQRQLQINNGWRNSYRSNVIHQLLSKNKIEHFSRYLVIKNVDRKRVRKPLLYDLLLLPWQNRTKLRRLS